jgi:hypothetical protein
MSIICATGLGTTTVTPGLPGRPGLGGATMAWLTGTPPRERTTIRTLRRPHRHFRRLGLGR